MSYKKLITAIHNMQFEAEFEGILSDIDKSFETERITGNDHETLYDLACWVWKSKRTGEYVRLI